MIRASEITPWALIALIGAAAATLMAMRGFSFVWASALRPALPCLALMALVAFYRLRRPDERIAVALSGVAQLVAFTAFTATLSYVVASEGGRMQDDLLMRADQALGLDWRAYLDLVNAHPWIRTAFGVAYQSILVQIIAAAVVLGLSGRATECRVFVLAVILSGLVAVLVSAAVPALSVYTHLGLRPQDYPGIDTTGAFAPVAPFTALRNGTLRVFSLTDAEGIIAFPSFHASLSVIFTYCLWSVRWLRWPALALNLVLLASTPINGGHYFVDVLAGMIVAVASLAAARAIERRGAAESFPELAHAQTV